MSCLLMEMSISSSVILGKVDPERGNKVKMRKKLPFFSNSSEILAWPLKSLE